MRRLRQGCSWSEERRPSWLAYLESRLQTSATFNSRYYLVPTSLHHVSGPAHQVHVKSEDPAFDFNNSLYGFFPTNSNPYCLVRYLQATITRPTEWMNDKIAQKIHYFSDFYRAMLRRAPLWDCISSVRLSVSLSMTFRYRDHIVWNTSKAISRADPNMGDLVQLEHPKIRVE